MDIQFALQDTPCVVLLVLFLHYNHCTGQKKATLDSTESRDHNTDQENLPVTATPAIDAFVTVRPQIIFFQQNYFDEICSIVTYVANAIHPVPSLPNSSITVSSSHIRGTNFVSGSMTTRVS